MSSESFSPSKDLTDWFKNVRDVLETTYLSHDAPWRQSGMSGPEVRWTDLRKPIAECVDRSGTFLDIGCANGYLLECVVKWTAERNLQIVPYGLDFSARLLELARKRLPGYADNFFLGNALTWLPPRRFDYVRTELVYVPTEYERYYVRFLLQNHLERHGKLLVANYGEGAENPEKGLLPGCHPTRWLQARLDELEFTPLAYKDGFDPVKGRRVRVAILDRSSS